MKEKDKMVDVDSRIAEAMKQLPKAGESAWFTRKVFNRLPERRRRIASQIEMGVCVVGIIVAAIFGIRFVKGTIDAGVFTIGDMILYATFVAIIIALASNIAGYLLLRPVRGMIQRRKGMAKM